MAYKNICLLVLFSYITISCGFSTQHDEHSQVSTVMIHESHPQKYMFTYKDIELEENTRAAEKIQVQMYYECMCPGCMHFDTNGFKEAIIKLGNYLDISTYPYGKAKTCVDYNKRITFECQHGPAECYGNMLHACALDILINTTQALLYNSCMMEPENEDLGSDDRAADRCAQRMQLDSEPIKSCAKGNRGIELQLYNGAQSTKMNYTYLPYILVNQKLSSKDTFIKDICSVFASQPPECLQF